MNTHKHQISVEWDSSALRKVSGPLMLLLYYTIIFFSSILLADLSAIKLLDVGTSTYLIDLIFIYFFGCFFFVAVVTKFRFYNVSRWYLALTVVLLMSIVYGMRKFGFSAIGEGRYIYWIFAFSVPLFFYITGYIRTLRDYDKFFKQTYILVIANVLLLLVIELINGGRFFLAASNQEYARLEDDRGVRYLGSEEVFHLGVGLIFLLIERFKGNNKSKVISLLTLFLFSIILFTKNRAALLSLVVALIIIFIHEGKAKIVIRLALIVAGLLSLSFLFFPALTLTLLNPIIRIVDPMADETGGWRLLIQAAAIEQGLQTPIFGQGFGGYFEYYVEAFNETITYPPHSIYVHLFQKTGLIGLLTYIFAIVSLIKQNNRMRPITKNNETAEKYRMLLKVLIVAQIFYGFVYNFSVFLGFYVGMQAVLLSIMNKKASLNKE